MMTIQILGTGCPKCMKLFENTRAAANQLGVEYALEKVTDLTEIMKYGVMMTPALVIDGRVVSSGKILDTREIIDILEARAGTRGSDGEP